MELEYGLKCEICGHREKYNLKYHLEEVHNISTKEYRKRFPKSRTMTGHSKRTLEFWIYQGYSLEEAKRLRKNHQSTIKFFIQNRMKEGLTEEEAKKAYHQKSIENSVRRVEFYLNRGLSEEEARKGVAKAQSILSAFSSKFRGHVHTKESKRRISNSVKKYIQETGVEKRVKNFQKGRRKHQSRSEIECFNLLKESLPELQANLEVGGKLVDMLYKNETVIEYNGDFWHRNPRLYKPDYMWKGYSSQYIWDREARRTKQILEAGYRVFVIWELDWKGNKSKVIEDLKKFLDGSKTEGETGEN